MADKLMLLDSASLYFRAFYGMKDTVTAADGTPVNAVRGFLDSIARLVNDHHPTRLVCCWDDDWRPEFRVSAIPSYKAHRVADVVANEEEVPDELSPQVPVIADVLAAFGLARVGAPGFEADDVIGTLASRASVPVDVVTGDRDLFQLVDDARAVRVLYTAKGGVARPDIVTESFVEEKYGIPGTSYADFAALRGDPSDGLPGVPGIGEKTAAALITSYGSLDGVIAAAQAGDAGARATVHGKVLAALDYLAVAPMVVGVARDCPVPEHDDRLPAAPADADALDELTQRWNLGSSVARLRAALASNGS
ncbi:MAG TPA: 5'-3' exonuclease [Candidatus Nanopelagicales bacterium]|nr:5'-3' exonuclease [Candidatus Nanopelagicales bacterium]